jgi:hypothetical protein
MVSCHLSSEVALRHSLLKNAAPKAHPKMKNDKWSLINDHFFSPVVGT